MGHPQDHGLQYTNARISNDLGVPLFEEPLKYIQRLTWVHKKPHHAERPLNILEPVLGLMGICWFMSANVL